MTQPKCGPLGSRIGSSFVDHSLASFSVNEASVPCSEPSVVCPWITCFFLWLLKDLGMCVEEKARFLTTSPSKLRIGYNLLQFLG